MTIFLKGLLTLGLLVGTGGVVTGSYFFKEQLGLGNKGGGEISRELAQGDSNSGAVIGIQDTSKGDSGRNNNEHVLGETSDRKEQQGNLNSGNGDSGNISGTDNNGESSTLTHTARQPENPSLTSGSLEISKQS